MLLVAELQRNRGILCLQSIEEPRHHEGNLGLAYIIRIAPRAPRESEVPKRREFAKDEYNLINIVQMITH